MTARQIFEGLLIELSKVNAPSLLLSEYNYYINKAINQYINKRYNIYDINQQTTDDLRVLKATTKLDVVKVNDDDYNVGNAKLFGATYEVYLPNDYLHMLNCSCIYEMLKTHKCDNKGDYVYKPAKRLTADSWSNIVNDFYFRPTPERPYYYIHNINTSADLPTNPTQESDTINKGTDMVGLYKVDSSSNAKILAGDPETVTKNQTTGTNFNRVITINGIKINTVERETAWRYGNTSRVRCEIRYGRDSSVYKLVKVHIDYIKAPQYIRLTQEQIDLTEDTSQMMEFPDYVCQEIINELVLLVMEKTADPRLNTHASITQSIANPAQAQQQPQQQQNQ